MKICICCSLSFGSEVRKIAKELENAGHEVLLPNGVINRLNEHSDFDPVKAKLETDPYHKHTDKIRASDVVLMCNYTKNGIEHYIGANSFAELFVAYYFNKPIYSLHSLPNMPYINDEIQALGIIILNGDLGKIKSEDSSSWSKRVASPA